MYNLIITRTIVTAILGKMESKAIHVPNPQMLFIICFKHSYILVVKKQLPNSRIPSNNISEEATSIAQISHEIPLF